MILYCEELNELIVVELGRIEFLDKNISWSVTSWIPGILIEECMREKELIFVGWL